MWGPIDHHMGSNLTLAGFRCNVTWLQALCSTWSSTMPLYTYLIKYLRGRFSIVWVYLILFCTTASLPPLSNSATWQTSLGHCGCKWVHWTSMSSKMPSALTCYEVSTPPHPFRTHVDSVLEIILPFFMPWLRCCLLCENFTWVQHNPSSCTPLASLFSHSNLYYNYL